MPHFDSKKIEKAAVLAVKSLIQRCETIDEKIKDDDKDVLIDGSLELYSSSNFRKPNLIGKVNVQVKGKSGKLEKNKRGFCKYNVNVEDLRKYDTVFHGVLFFCVAVGPEGGVPIGKEVYYAQLLPHDINKILQTTSPGQKKVGVRLRPFPENPREITRLIMEFHDDQEKQLKAKVTGYGFLDETTELPEDVKSWNFSVRLFPGEQITDLPFLPEGPYIYGEDAHGQLSVIGKMNDVIGFGVGREAVVTSGNYSHTTTVFTGQSTDGDFIEFDDIRIVLSERKARLDYTVSGGFRKRYNTVHFMREFRRTGELLVDGKKAISAVIEEDGEAQNERLDTSFKMYSHAVETLDLLRIKADWDPESLTAKELRDIEYMRRLIVEKEPYTGAELASCLIHFDIQGSQIFAFAHKLDSRDGYKLLDLNSKELYFAFGDESDETGVSRSVSAPVPPLASLTKDNFKRVANLDSREFDAALERIPIVAGNQCPLNQCLLEMLAAYDEGCQFPTEVLDCAIVLAKRLHEYDSTSTTYYLNLMQSVRRKRPLTEEERSRLKDVAVDSNLAYEKAAAFALLDDVDMAARYRNRCSSEERFQLDEYPISLFF